VCELFVRREVQVGEEDEPFTEPSVLLRERLLDLQNHVRRRPDVVHGRDLRTHVHVVGVREGTADARARLDDDLVTARSQLAGSGGRESDPVLVLLDLLGDADPHEAGQR
jgi:hypothetical protein